MTLFSTVNVMDVQKISIANARANAMLAREETALARKIDYIAAALEEFANAFEASSKPVHAEPAGMPPDSLAARSRAMIRPRRQRALDQRLTAPWHWAVPTP